MYKKSLKKFDSELAQKQNKLAQFEELSEKELDEVVGASEVTPPIFGRWVGGKTFILNGSVSTVPLVWINNFQFTVKDYNPLGLDFPEYEIPTYEWIPK